MRRNVKTLYVSDLDGTLLNSGSRVSDASREMLNRAIAEGALFTVATARTPATVSKLLEGVDLTLPAIVMTGAALWDKASGHYSDVRHILEDTARAILNTLIDNHVSSFIYSLSDDIIRVNHTGEMSPLEAEFIAQRIGNPFKKLEISTDSPDRTPDDMSRVVLFFAMQPTELIRPAAEKIRDLDVVANFYHDSFGPEIAILETFAPGTTKAAAIRRLADRLGAERVVAFGDNVNDLPMLAEADVAVAVANAIDEVKRQADVVVGSNDSDAVARFILDDITANTLKS